MAGSPYTRRRQHRTGTARAPHGHRTGTARAQYGPRNIRTDAVRFWDGISGPSNRTAPVPFPRSSYEYLTMCVRVPHEPRTICKNRTGISRLPSDSRPTAARRPRFPCGPHAAPSRPCFFRAAQQVYVGRMSLQCQSSVVGCWHVEDCIIVSKCCPLCPLSAVDLCTTFAICDSDFLHGRRAIDL